MAEVYFISGPNRGENLKSIEKKYVVESLPPPLILQVFGLKSVLMWFFLVNRTFLSMLHFRMFVL